MSLESRIRPGPDTSGIDPVVAYISGPFAGRTIRAQLTEVQKADLGRKYVLKDRRPLDPPPIVQLGLFEIHGHNTQNCFEEEILSSDDTTSYGFLCHLDLFSVPSPTESPHVLHQRPPTAPSPTQTLRTRSTASAVRSFTTAQIPEPTPRNPAPGGFTCILPPPLPPSFFLMGGAVPMEALPGVPTADHSAFSSSPVSRVRSLTSGTHYSTPLASTSASPLTPVVPWPFFVPGSHDVANHQARGALDSAPMHAIAYHGDETITTASMCTEMLAGTTVKDSSTILLYGKNSTIFVFSDVAVRREGTFFLRYRVFYMFSQATGSRPNPVIAECFGQPFKIYSTKEFPGLHASTDLTKLVSMSGIGTNVRAHERKRRRTTTYASTIVSSGSQDKAALGDEPPTSRKRTDALGLSTENEDLDSDDVDEGRDRASPASPSLGTNYDY